MTKRIAVVQIRLTPEELEQVRADAGTRGIAVSEYIRRALLFRKPSVSATVAKLREEIPELKTASELPAKRVKTCAHGKGKGFHCWQCGGIAKVESTS